MDSGITGSRTKVDPELCSMVGQLFNGISRQSGAAYEGLKSGKKETKKERGVSPLMCRDVLGARKLARMHR